jgi:hypothetical protein
MTARERSEHGTHWQQTQVGRATAPPCRAGTAPPPRAQTGWYPPCAGELNSKQAGLHLEGGGGEGLCPADR